MSDVMWMNPDTGEIWKAKPQDRYIPDTIVIQVPGGRYWEPGVEENPPLPEDQWLPDDIKLPFE